MEQHMKKYAKFDMYLVKKNPSGESFLDEESDAFDGEDELSSALSEYAHALPGYLHGSYLHGLYDSLKGKITTLSKTELPFLDTRIFKEIADLSDSLRDAHLQAKQQTAATLNAASLRTPVNNFE